VLYGGSSVPLRLTTSVESGKRSGDSFKSIDLAFGLSRADTEDSRQAKDSERANM
jgi:hypothetical protein